MAKPSIESYNTAVDAVQSGDLPAALNAIETSLTEDPKDAQSWQLYAVVLNALGESEKAAKAMVKVKDLGLSEVDELLMKAGDAAAGGKLGVAITYYEDALELDDSRAEIYTAYAIALMEEKYFKDALEAAAKAVELAPDDAYACYAHGRSLRLNGKDVQALEMLTAATKVDPSLVLAHYERGMLLAASGELEEALSCFETVLKDHPEDLGASEAKASIIAEIEREE
jgi:tetratricopeptide (TPR) repeat protein